MLRCASFHTPILDRRTFFGAKSGSAKPAYEVRVMDPGQPSVVELLLANLSRDLVLRIEEGLEAGAQRAIPVAQGMHQGHRSTVRGQMRHFCMNEGFAEALELGGAFPSRIKGNELVVGHSGILRLARFNITADGPWYNARRSVARMALSEANKVVEALVHPDLFEPPRPVSTATVFFVGVFSKSLTLSLDRPVSVQIAVPAPGMRNWLFRETISDFVSRYNAAAAAAAAEVQPDLAHPVLKSKVARKNEG
jgi:hypothetical protein